MLEESYLYAGGGLLHFIPQSLIHARVHPPPRVRGAGPMHDDELALADLRTGGFDENENGT